MTKTPTVCILYGFCEGPHMATKMRAVLMHAGFTVVADPYRADIILAHSGGCFLVPPDTRAQQIVMIGLTHWPGKSIARAVVEKTIKDLGYFRKTGKFSDWLQKFAWNLFYFWKLRHNLRMLYGRHTGLYWQANHVTVIRNREDSFCAPGVSTMQFKSGAAFLSLPDQHDDLWLHPDRYVAIIKRNATNVLVPTDRRQPAVPQLTVE